MSWLSSESRASLSLSGQRSAPQIWRAAGCKRTTRRSAAWRELLATPAPPRGSGERNEMMNEMSPAPREGPCL